MANKEAQGIALGYASMALIAAWQAAKTSDTGQKLSAEQIAQVEQEVASGALAVGVYLQRVGETLRVVVAARPPEWEDPFAGAGLLDLTGPLVESVEQLARLVPIEPGTLN